MDDDTPGPARDWAPAELDGIDAEDELGIASERPDSSLRPFVTIWFARLGNDLYVRSAYGPDNGWFRRAQASGVGRIRVAGVERDVRFEVPGPDIDDDLHAAYRAKYGRYAPGIVRTVISPEAARSTLRVRPR